MQNIAMEYTEPTELKCVFVTAQVRCYAVGSSRYPGVHRRSLTRAQPLQYMLTHDNRRSRPHSPSMYNGVIIQFIPVSSVTHHAA